MRAEGAGMSTVLPQSLAALREWQQLASDDSRMTIVICSPAAVCVTRITDFFGSVVLRKPVEADHC